MRVLLLFLDGVGIGPDDPDVNPFLQAHLPDDDPGVARFRGTTLALDATLETDGTPQSGTGQVALLTGRNAAEIHGGHFGPWTPISLRPLVEETSVLRRVRDAGRSVAFANAYPRGWPGPRGSRRVAGPPLVERRPPPRGACRRAGTAVRRGTPGRAR